MSKRKQDVYKLRRYVAVVVVILLGGTGLVYSDFNPDIFDTSDQSQVEVIEGSALDILGELEVKGRAPRTGYERAEFGNGWGNAEGGCDMRNVILARDLDEIQYDEECRITSGILEDPYTATTIQFRRGPDTSQEVQIDHVVALSDAWQKGAQQLDYDRRVAFSNDPLNLLAVDGPINQAKGDSDAATWLPPNRAYRCAYVARQIAVKHTYDLWVTAAERDAKQRVLSRCPEQQLPAR